MSTNTPPGGSLSPNPEPPVHFEHIDPQQSSIIPSTHLNRATSLQSYPDFSAPADEPVLQHSYSLALDPPTQIDPLFQSQQQAQQPQQLKAKLKNKPLPSFYWSSSVLQRIAIERLKRESRVLRSSLRTRRVQGRSAWHLSSSSDSQHTSSSSEGFSASTSELSDSDFDSDAFFSTSSSSSSSDDESEDDGGQETQALITGGSPTYGTVADYDEKGQKIIPKKSIRKKKLTIRGFISKHITKPLNKKFFQQFHDISLILPSIWIEYCWSLNELLLMTYLSSLHIPTQYASLIWLCNPLFGIMIQPIVGNYCDNNTSTYGRRRPYILGLLAISLFGYLLLGILPFFAFSGAERTELNLASSPVISPSHYKADILVSYQYVCFTFFAVALAEMTMDTLLIPLKSLIADVSTQKKAMHLNTLFGSIGSTGRFLALLTITMFVSDDIFSIPYLYLVSVIMVGLICVTPVLFFVPEVPLVDIDDDSEEEDEESDDDIITPTGQIPLQDAKTQFSLTDPLLTQFDGNSVTGSAQSYYHADSRMADGTYRQRAVQDIQTARQNHKKLIAEIKNKDKMKKSADSMMPYIPKTSIFPKQGVKKDSRQQQQQSIQLAISTTHNIPPQPPHATAPPSLNPIPSYYDPLNTSSAGLEAHPAMSTLSNLSQGLVFPPSTNPVTNSSNYTNKVLLLPHLSTYSKYQTNDPSKDKKQNKRLKSPVLEPHESIVRHISPFPSNQGPLYEDSAHSLPDPTDIEDHMALVIDATKNTQEPGVSIDSKNLYHNNLNNSVFDLYDNNDITSLHSFTGASSAFPPRNVQPPSSNTSVSKGMYPSFTSNILPSTPFFTGSTANVPPPRTVQFKDETTFATPPPLQPQRSSTMKQTLPFYPRPTQSSMMISATPAIIPRISTSTLINPSGSKKKKKKSKKYDKKLQRHYYDKVSTNLIGLSTTSSTSTSSESETATSSSAGSNISRSSVEDNLDMKNKSGFSSIFGVKDGKTKTKFSNAVNQHYNNAEKSYVMAIRNKNSRKYDGKRDFSLDILHHSPTLHATQLVQKHQDSDDASLYNLSTNDQPSDLSSTHNNNKDHFPALSSAGRSGASNSHDHEGTAGTDAGPVEKIKKRRRKSHYFTSSSSSDSSFWGFESSLSSLSSSTSSTSCSSTTSSSSDVLSSSTDDDEINRRVLQLPDFILQHRKTFNLTEQLEQKTVDNASSIGTMRNENVQQIDNITVKKPPRYKKIRGWFVNLFKWSESSSDSSEDEPQHIQPIRTRVYTNFPRGGNSPHIYTPENDYADLNAVVTSDAILGTIDSAHHHEEDGDHPLNITVYGHDDHLDMIDHHHSITGYYDSYQNGAKVEKEEEEKLTQQPLIPKSTNISDNVTLFTTVTKYTNTPSLHPAVSFQNSQQMQSVPTQPGRKRVKYFYHTSFERLRYKIRHKLKKYFLYYPLYFAQTVFNAIKSIALTSYYDLRDSFSIIYVLPYNLIRLFILTWLFWYEFMSIAMWLTPFVGTAVFGLPFGSDFEGGEVGNAGEVARGTVKMTIYNLPWFSRLTPEVLETYTIAPSLPIQFATLLFVATGAVAFCGGLFIIPYLNKRYGLRVSYYLSVLIQVVPVLILCLTPAHQIPILTAILLSLNGLGYCSLQSQPLSIMNAYFSPDYRAVVNYIDKHHNVELLLPFTYKLITEYRLIVRTYAAYYNKMVMKQRAGIPPTSSLIWLDKYIYKKNKNENESNNKHEQSHLKKMDLTDCSDKNTLPPLHPTIRHFIQQTQNEDFFVLMDNASQKDSKGTDKRTRQVSITPNQNDGSIAAGYQQESRLQEQELSLLLPLPELENTENNSNDTYIDIPHNSAGDNHDIDPDLLLPINRQTDTVLPSYSLIHHQFNPYVTPLSFLLNNIATSSNPLAKQQHQQQQDLVNPNLLSKSTTKSVGNKLKLLQSPSMNVNTLNKSQQLSQIQDALNEEDNSNILEHQTRYLDEYQHQRQPNDDEELFLYNIHYAQHLNGVTSQPPSPSHTQLDFHHKCLNIAPEPLPSSAIHAPEQKEHYSIGGSVVNSYLLTRSWSDTDIIDIKAQLDHIALQNDSSDDEEEKKNKDINVTAAPSAANITALQPSSSNVSITAGVTTEQHQHIGKKEKELKKYQLLTQDLLAYQQQVKEQEALKQQQKEQQQREQQQQPTVVAAATNATVSLASSPSPKTKALTLTSAPRPISPPTATIQTPFPTNTAPIKKPTIIASSAVHPKQHPLQMSEPTSHFQDIAKPLTNKELKRITKSHILSSNLQYQQQQQYLNPDNTNPPTATTSPHLSANITGVLPPLLNPKISLQHQISSSSTLNPNDPSLTAIASNPVIQQPQPQQPSQQISNKPQHLDKVTFNFLEHAKRNTIHHLSKKNKKISQQQHKQATQLQQTSALLYDPILMTGRPGYGYHHGPNHKQQPLHNVHEVVSETLQHGNSSIEQLKKAKPYLQYLLDKLTQQRVKRRQQYQKTLNKYKHKQLINANDGNTAIAAAAASNTNNNLVFGFDHDTYDLMYLKTNNTADKQIDQSTTIATTANNNDDISFGQTAAFINTSMTLAQIVMGLTAGIIMSIFGSVLSSFILSTTLLGIVACVMLYYDLREWTHDELIAQGLKAKKQEKRLQDLFVRKMQREIEEDQVEFKSKL